MAGKPKRDCSISYRSGYIVTLVLTRNEKAAWNFQAAFNG